MLVGSGQSRNYRACWHTRTTDELMLWSFKKNYLSVIHTDLLFHLCIFIGWFLYVPWLGIKPSSLVYWDDTLTNCFYPSRMKLQSWICICLASARNLSKDSMLQSSEELLFLWKTSFFVLKAFNWLDEAHSYYGG